MSMGTTTGTSGSSGGKSSGGMMPNSGGYQPTQAAQQQFQSGMPQQQPGVAQTLNQISGVSSPAMNTLVNQQMAPQGSTGPAPNQMNQLPVDQLGKPLQQLDQLVGGPGPGDQMAFPMDYNTIGTQPNPGQTFDALGGMKPADALGGGLAQQDPATGQPYGQIMGDPLQYAQPMLDNSIGAPGMPSDYQMAFPMETETIGTQPNPITLPGGQSLNLNPPAAVAQPLMPAPDMSAQQRFADYSNAVFGGNPNSVYTPNFNPAPAPQPVAQPRAVAQNLYQQLGATPPAPRPVAPMPTKATQGYTSRVAPKPAPKAAPVRAVNMNIGTMNRGAIARSGVVGNKSPVPVRVAAKPAPKPKRR